MAEQKQALYADRPSFLDGKSATSTTSNRNVLMEKDGNVMLYLSEKKKKPATSGAKRSTCEVNGSVFRNKKLLPLKKRDHPVNRSVLLENEYNDNDVDDDTSSVDTAELIRRLRAGRSKGDDFLGSPTGCAGVHGVSRTPKPKQEADGALTTITLDRNFWNSPVLTTAQSKSARVETHRNEEDISTCNQEVASPLYSFHLPVGSDVSEHIDDDEESVATIELQRRLRSCSATKPTNTILYNDNTIGHNAEPNCTFVLPFDFASSSSSSEEEDYDEEEKVTQGRWL